MEARGNFAEMKRFLGTAKLTNLIADKTRRLEAKRRNQCESIDGKRPHTPADHEKPLGFSHNPWKSRLAILEECLAKYKESDGPITLTTVYYIPDLDQFEREFIDAHLPWENSGKVLCKTCDREWIAWWVKQQPQTAPKIVGPIHPLKTMALPQTTRTIEELTVELIFQGLSNTDVLAGIRKVYPGRATMNTVAWYRSHLIHDRSPKFDKLRAGRIPPASRR